MKRITASYIINILESKYRGNQYLLNNEKDNKQKEILIIRKNLLEDIINQIEEKRIDLNGGINYK